MSLAIGQAFGDTQLPRASWWLYAVTVAFVGYFTLLAHSDLTRPEPHGFTVQIQPRGLVLSSVAPDSPAARAGLASGDLIVAAHGRAIHGRLDWQVAETNWRPREPFSIEVQRAGRHHTQTLVLDRAPWRYRLTTAGATLMGARGVQLVTLALALLVAFKRPHDPAARAGAWLLGTFAVYSVVLPFGIAANWRSLPSLLGIPLWVPFLSSLAVGGVLFTFFATFPRPLIQRGWLWMVAWLPMAALLTLQLQFAFVAVYQPQASGVLIDWTEGAVAVSAGYVLAALAMVVIGYRRLDDLTQRRRVRVLVMGSLVGFLGFLPVVSGYWRSGAAFGDTVFDSPIVALGTVIGLAFPVSFAYAILRHRLFDVRVIVRRGMQYAMARSVLVSLVPILGAVFAVDLWVHRQSTFTEVLQARGWVYLGLSGLVLVARSQRTRWLDALDRRFFRERYSAQRVMRTVIEQVKVAGDITDAAGRLVHQLEATFHPEVVALFTRETTDRRFRLATCEPADSDLGVLPKNSKVVSFLQWFQKPAHVSGAAGSHLLKELPSDDISWLRDVRADLLVPVTVGEHIDGFFVLGPKRSEEPYSADDEDLLMAVAESLAFVRAQKPAFTDEALEAFQDCPVCGACYDWGTDQCPQDEAMLSVVKMPRVLGGRYRLDQRVGRGGMGTVYAAFDLALNRRVAAKLIREDLVGGVGTADRFQSEARLAAALAHPNVVTVHDIGVTKAGRAFFIMELLVGSTLRDELQRSQRLPVPRVRQILRGVCLAVDAAHQREMIHRDLKPENVFLCQGDVSKVLDFGVAKALETTLDTAVTQPGYLVGTPPYMAPERLRGEAASPRWDLWAVAVMAVEMIGGRRPFAEAPVMPPHLEGLSPELSQFFVGALALDPRNRPASALGFFDELDQLLGPS